MRADAPRHVTLVAPGLLGPPLAPDADHDEALRLLCEGLSPPALERFLGRARRAPTEATQEGLAATLFGCFGVVRDGPDWPVAAVTYGVDAGSDAPQWVMRVDPVHLRASMGTLVLADTRLLRLGASEAASLAAAINEGLGDPGLRIVPLAPTRWYLCPDAPPKLLTPAPWDMVGAPVDARFPGGEDGARWRALINDIQMILHASPTNHAREARGEPPINSVWPWGGGQPPRIARSAWVSVWHDETLAEGLARLAGACSGALPAHAGAWLAQAPASGHHLLVITSGYAAARSSDVDGWRQFVEYLERCWMAPLLDALATGRVSSVALRTGGAFDLRLGRGRLRHWWRRPLPLARMLAAQKK